MKTRSMEQTIGRRLYLMGFVSLVLAVAVCVFVFHQAFTMQAWRALQNESAILAAQYSQDSQVLRAVLVDDLRITLISPDGTVLYESTDADEQVPMENHLSRPEVQQAFSTGAGRDIRASVTTGYETYYYAVLLSDGNVLRTAQEAKSIWSLYNDALPAILVSCLVILALGALLAAVLTSRLVKPMLNMANDLDRIQEKVPYSELIPFADAIYSDRAARESNEKLRQEFTANVSHELKTPLTSISGYAEMIETGLAKPEDVASFGQKIHKEASRMIRLVNDIIQLSHLDSSGSTHDTPVMQPVDLGVVAKECADRLKMNARRAYVTLNFHGDSIQVMGSPSLLEELCQNLCDNAIRYNQPGGRVLLETGHDQEGHPYLKVQDNGIGIPKEAQASVFERFYRVDKSRSKATGGTGLGLAIVKQIARIHDARIHLESELGKGTTVTITFQPFKPNQPNQ